MQKKAVFPGTFDPFTLGHESIVKKAIPLFDEIIIAVGKNSTKNALFEMEQRIQWIEATFANEPKIKVETYSGLTVDYCLAQKAQFLIRGLRNAQDFTYESAIEQMNHALKPEVTSVFYICEARYAAISSSIVREIIKNGGDAEQFLPAAIKIA